MSFFKPPEPPKISSPAMQPPPPTPKPTDPEVEEEVEEETEELKRRKGLGDTILTQPTLGDVDVAIERATLLGL